MNNSLETLDDIYSTGHQDQKAYNVLVNFEEMKEELVWTGRPLPSFSYYQQGYKDLSKKLSPLFFFGYIIILQFSSIGAFLFVILLLFLVLNLVVLLLLTEIVRRKTYYGISEGKVWVKTWLKALQAYPVEQLTRLKLEKNTVFYSTIVKQDYNKYPLLRSIPQAAAVYELIKAYQEKSFR